MVSTSNLVQNWHGYYFFVYKIIKRILASFRGTVCIDVQQQIIILTSAKNTAKFCMISTCSSCRVSMRGVDHLTGSAMYCLRHVMCPGAVGPEPPGWNDGMVGGAEGGGGAYCV